MNLILLIVVLLTGCSLMVLIAPHDIALSTWLYERKSQRLVDLMSDSVFELEALGGGDLIVFFAVVCVLLYVGSSLIDVDCSTHRLWFRVQTWLNRRSHWADWLRRQRFRLEFLVVSTFCCSTLMVKLLKWTMARPRPKKYFWGTRPFYEWWEVGPYFLDEGPYRASFPSGHTASVITLMALVYLLLFSFGDRPRRRSGVMLLLFTLVFAAVMAVARVMTRAHWPTDVTFSIFGGWVLIHILFFYGLRVRSGGAAAAPAEICPPPPFRGIRLCWYLTLFSLSLTGLFIGLRHVFNGHWPWLGVVALASVSLLAYAVVKTREEGLFSDRFS